MAQSGKCPTSAQVRISPFMSSSPTSGSVRTARSLEPPWDSVSPCLCPSPTRVLSLSLCLSLSLRKAPPEEHRLGGRLRMFQGRLLWRRGRPAQRVLEGPVCVLKFPGFYRTPVSLRGLPVFSSSPFPPFHSMATTCLPRAQIESYQAPPEKQVVASPSSG